MTDIEKRLAQAQKEISAWEHVASNGTFEESMDALEGIVGLLDQGELTLDLSVQCFELGTKLSERCQQLLEAAELRISILSPVAQYDDEDTADPWSEDPEP